MNVIINGHHIRVTDAMETAVTNKLEKVARHCEYIQSIQVLLSLDNHHSEASHNGQNNHKAEAIMRVAGREMFVQSGHDDMYQAINGMADKLTRQIRKYKTRQTRPARVNNNKQSLPAADNIVAMPMM